MCSYNQEKYLTTLRCGIRINLLCSTSIRSSAMPSQICLRILTLTCITLARLARMMKIPGSIAKSATASVNYSVNWFLDWYPNTVRWLSSPPPTPPSCGWTIGDTVGDMTGNYSGLTTHVAEIGISTGLQLDSEERRIACAKYSPGINLSYGRAC